jgi:hypothetical protein
VTKTVDSQADNNQSEHLESLSKAAKHKATADKLSGQETREILTPLAFKIDKSLFGMALAVPWRRGAALTVDLFLVALLSEVPGELLALLVAVTLFNVGSKKRAKKRGKISGIRQTILRMIAALIVFVVLIDILPKLFSKLDTINNQVEQAGLSSENKKQGSDGTSNDFIKVTLTLAANLAVSHSECEALPCWQKLSNDLASGYAEQSTSALDAKQFNANLVDNISEKSDLTEQEIATIDAQLKKAYALKQTEKTIIDQNTLKVTVLNNAEATKVNLDNKTSKIVDSTALDEAKQVNAANIEPANPKVYKGLAWLKGLVEDLGLGFGWAAFYFTMFTALWYGQTPGKKLFNIRVIQLDGTPLSVWDSFGRYGGYGAGIATGLLGFAQIFWDPNRQAIHDKISSTIVINDSDFGKKKYKQNIIEHPTGDAS